MAQPLLLDFDHLVRIEKNVRSKFDERRRVDRYLLSYYAGKDEYRKSIEVKPGAPCPEFKQRIPNQ